LEIFHIFGLYPNMKYSDYFSYHLKYYGIPKLNLEQYQRMMNIVFMEGYLSGLSDNPSEKIKNSAIRYRGIKSLNELTKRLPPQNLLIQMEKLSEKK
tara:strand:+ start:13584 stop:13874 length:291 start_codon:yes stop_codon:yes gene_type:complete